MPGLDWAGSRTVFDRVEARWPQLGRYRNRVDHRLQPLTVRWRHVRRFGPLPNWLPGVLAITLLVVLLAPPQTVFVPTGGLDPSYYAGLAMAKAQGLSFGSEVMFTYGPWGFLENTGVYETGPAWWATLYRVLVQTGAVFALVAVLRHNFGRLATLLIAFVAARWGFELMYGVGPSRLLSVTVIGVLVFVLTRRVPPGRAWALTAAAIGSFLVLVKFNDGVVVLTAAAVAAAVTGLRTARAEGARPTEASDAAETTDSTEASDEAELSGSTGVPSRRAVVVGAVVELVLAGMAGLVSLVVLWLLAGQSLGDLPRFVKGSLELSRGFSRAMQTTSAGAMGDVLVALLSGAGAVAACWLAARKRSAATQAGVVLVAGALLYGTWKHGFVRQGADRELFYFLGVALLMLFAARTRWRSVAAVVALGVMGWSVSHFGYEPSERLSLLHGPVGWGDTLSVLTSGDARADFRQDGFDYLRASYRLPAEIYDAIDGQQVHVDQWETALAWAFTETQWRPLPVFQRYTAYTPWLDNADAEAMSGLDAPAMIVAERNVIDRHLNRFDAPHTVRSMVCNYRLTVPADPVPVGRNGVSLAETVDDAGKFARTPPWVLWTLADNRCGEVEAGETVTAGPGDVVSVPIEPGEAYFVLARFYEVDGRPVDRLRQFVWKGDEWFFRTGFTGPSDAPEAQTFRFVTSTATQWHVLSWPACLNMKPEAFDPGSITSFRLAPGTRPSSDSWDVTLADSGEPYQVTFATQPYRCD